MNDPGGDEKIFSKLLDGIYTNNEHDALETYVFTVEDDKIIENGDEVWD